jgi:DNA-binding response OmpR family regulator
VNFIHKPFSMMALAAKVKAIMIKNIQDREDMT